jgi:hypothetical protein
LANRQPGGLEALRDARPGRWLRATAAGTPEDRIDLLEREVEELKAKAFAPSFYRGIPSSAVIRALDDLGFGGLATLDDLPPSGTSVYYPRS